MSTSPTNLEERKDDDAGLPGKDFVNPSAAYPLHSLTTPTSATSSTTSGSSPVLPATTTTTTTTTTSTTTTSVRENSASSPTLPAARGATSVAGLPAPAKRNGLPARHSGSIARPLHAEPFPIPPVEGIATFYPQSLWVEAKNGGCDHDRMTHKSTYRLPAHKRLVAGKYVEDPDLKDFSNPRYHGGTRSTSQGPSRLSRLGEFLRTSSPRPPLAQPSSYGGVTVRAAPAPPPVFAGALAGGRSNGTPASSQTGTTRSSTTGSYTTVGTSDYSDEYENDESEEDMHFEECVEDSEAEGRLPPLLRQSVRSSAGSKKAPNTVKQTYPVVEPIYPFSSASFYFPIYYGRPSAAEKADPRGLPQRINEEFHPNDRADMTLSSVAVQKDNLNRMALYKIGPGAVAFKVVMTAFEAAGMKYTTSNSKFNILWAKRATPYTLASLTPYQKVNHFPGTWGIGRKDSLAQNMTKMRRYFGDAVYDIVPTSFLLPRQEYEIKADAERNPGTPENPLIYILKPTASSCGRGIELCRGVPPMPRGGKQMVCQRYIGNPLLIFGRKFDLRLYCVVTSFDPLRVYLFDEGLVRFAAEKYSGPDQDLENVHKHLTNYSVNKTAELTRQSSGKDYDTDDPLDIKWCISDFKRHLLLHHPLGLEAWNKIQRECDDVVIKALLSIENDVIERIRQECKDRTGRNCFELFGLDLMADEDLKVRLIEANIMPSLATASNLDKAVKARMLAHLLTLVRAMPYRRNAIPKAERGRRATQPPRPPPAMSGASSPQPQSQPRSSSTRSTDTNGTRRTASQGHGRTPSTASRASAGKQEAKRTPVPTPRNHNEEEVNEGESTRRAVEQQLLHGRRQVSSANAVPLSVLKEKFVPHGPEADRPERTYRFGKHPMASARIMNRGLLKAFNDPRDPESMLTPYETLMLVEAEEELRCAGGFRRVFPVAATMHNYLPLFTHGVRRNNYVLCSAVQMHEEQKAKKD